MKHLVVGIDEVGRGAWAGPVVAGAVILPPGVVLPGVTDSKVMTPRRREWANRLIRERALTVGIGWVNAAEVDCHGLSWAVRESGIRALTAIATELPEVVRCEVILDGSHNYLEGTQYQSRAIIKADAQIASVSAASVVAKVARDHYLEVVGRRYPAYEFANHKGYGTAAHQTALASHGITPLHRLSYAPVAAISGVHRG